MSAAAAASAAPAAAPTESAAPAAAPVESTTPAEGTPAPASTEGTPAAAPAKLWSDPAPEAKKDDAAPTEPAAPEWFMKDKYKTIEDQAKARFDMEKLMGKNWGAPKDDYTIEGIEGIKADDPLLSHLKLHIKELGLSQNGFASLIKGYQQANIAMAEKMAAEVAETLVKTDALTVQSVDKWLKESFSQEDRETIQSWIIGVGDFKILNSLRLMMPGTSTVPSSTTGQSVKFESKEEVDNEKVKYRKEVASGSRVVDKNFENELQQRWRDAYQREERAKK
jgi:hypothetical protein